MTCPRFYTNRSESPTSGKACRVARTIADLAAGRRVGLPHAAEAHQYRLSGIVAPEETT